MATRESTGVRFDNISHLAGVILLSLMPLLASGRTITTKHVFLTLLLMMVASPSLQAASLQRDLSLMERAQANGEVPVIIQLQVATLAEGSLATAAGKTRRSQNISGAQNRLLGRMNAYQIKRLKKFRHLPFVAMELDAAGLQAALQDPTVVRVYEDTLSKATLAQSTPLIGATDAWASGDSGSGQVIAVLDTGVDSSHIFLSGKVVHEACFSTTNSGYNSNTVCPNGQQSQIGTGAGAPCPVDCDHGTHVAGIAAGSGATYSGAARDASIMSIQVFSQFTDYDDECSTCVLSFTSDQISALEHVYDKRTSFNIAAVNMSLGAGSYATSCDTEDPRTAAIELLRSVNIATVVSSGNQAYTDRIGAPACISAAVSVGSTTDTDSVSYFSNSAQILDLLAPGSDITSSVPNNGFVPKSGTSMAAPHVAGAFALLRAKTPAASVAEILAVLQSTGIPILDSRNEISTPRIQVDAALAAVESVLVFHTVTASASVGGSISPSGDVSIEEGQSTTFTVTPQQGHFVQGVTGCSGTLVGSTYTTEPIAAACSVAAQLSLIVAPSTPQITNIDYGDTEIYISVSVANNGGSAITSYGATCTDGTTQYTGTSATRRITLTGLTNGVAYTCTVISTNALGTSPTSAVSPPVTPEEAIAAGLPIWLLYEASK